jgi:hypothetical protein
MGPGLSSTMRLSPYLPQAVPAWPLNNFGLLHESATFLVAGSTTAQPQALPVYLSELGESSS